jgi:hypothetical protein
MDGDSQTPIETTPASDPDAEYLIHWLANRDAFCPLCNYNLRALQTPRCPECGEALRLRVTLAEPYLTAWIWLAAASFAGAGIGLLFLYVLVSEGYRSGGDGSMIFPSAVTISMIPVSLLAVVGRRRIQRLPPGIQWAFASFATILVLFAILTLMGKF